VAGRRSERRSLASARLAEGRLYHPGRRRETLSPCSTVGAPLRAMSPFRQTRHPRPTHSGRRRMSVARVVIRRFGVRCLGSFGGSFFARRDREDSDSGSQSAPSSAGPPPLPVKTTDTWELHRYGPIARTATPSLKNMRQANSAHSVWSGTPKRATRGSGTARPGAGAGTATDGFAENESCMAHRVHRRSLRSLDLRSCSPVPLSRTPSPQP
jgi:hypothetical protein